MGGESSKEQIDEVLLTFPPNERHHFYKVYLDYSEGNNVIEEDSFKRQCTLIPENNRASLYHAMIRCSNKNIGAVMGYLEFLLAMRFMKGTPEEKAKVCFRWCAEGKKTVNLEAIRVFTKMISSVAMGIHPIKIQDRFRYQVSDNFVDYLLRQIEFQEPTLTPVHSHTEQTFFCFPFFQIFRPKNTTLGGYQTFSYEDVIGGDDVGFNEMDLKLDKHQFISWATKTFHFMRIIDIVFFRLFFRDRDLFSGKEGTIEEIELNRKRKRERGLNPARLTNPLKIISNEEFWLINLFLPSNCRHKWRLLFSDTLHGKSWARLSANIMEQGSTVILIKDESDYIFGAFSSESWKKKPNFYGSSDNFLFTLRPKINFYSPSGFNQNYQYFNFGTKTLPNGMGFGGQFNYFGLWIDENFGEGQSKAEPLSTTYNSPRLSWYASFKISSIEIWGVLEPEIDPNREDPKQSILNQFKEDRVILELAGKQQHAKNIGKVENIEKDDK